MIISFLSMFVFITRDEETPLIDDPLAYLSTMLLTIVAFMIILKEDLPALKEPSILDRYLMFILLYVFALGLNFVFVDPLEFEDDDESHHWTTNPSVWVFAGIWL